MHPINKKIISFPVFLIETDAVHKIDIYCPL